MIKKLRLADFGNAVKLEDLQANLYSENELQTLLYRAPEVVLGLQGLGPGLDMWSAGLVLAEVGAVLQASLSYYRRYNMSEYTKFRVGYKYAFHDHLTAAGDSFCASPGHGPLTIIETLQPGPMPAVADRAGVSWQFLVVHDRLH